MFFKRFSFLIILMGFIAYASLRNHYTGPVGFLFGFFGLSFLHFTAYMAVTLSFLWPVSESYLNPVWAFVFSSVYGIFMEILQIFVPGRTFSFIDIMVDVAGSALGLFLLKLFAGKLRMEGISGG